MRPAELDALLVAPGFVADPYPVYALLRRHAPVHWCEPWGSWLVSRYDDCATILRDPGRFSSAGRIAAMLDRLPTDVRPEFAALDANFAIGMPNTDPPDHTRVRALVNRAFTPRVVEAMRPRIEAILDELLEPVAPRGRVELIGEVAHPLPARVILELLGVPVADRIRFAAWSNDVVAFFGTAGADLPTARRSLAAFHEASAWVAGAIAERRARPTGDLLSALVSAEMDGGALTEAEIVATSITLMTAGHETTTTLIGSAVLALLQHPAQLALLGERPDLIDAAIEEFLRYDAPFQQGRRRTTAPVDIAGVRIPAGAIVSELIGSANRDERQYAEPDRLDLQRPPGRHLALGLGIHFCVGAALARLEARVALPALLERLPALRLAPHGARWRWNTTFRGLDRLALEFEPSGSRRPSSARTATLRGVA